MNNKPIIPLYIKIILILLSASMIALTCLPDGIRMVFSKMGEDGRMVLYPEYYPYYSNLPVGYARWSGMFIFTFAILQTCSTILFFFRKREIAGLLIYIIIDVAIAILQLTDILFYFSVTWINFVILGLSILAGALGIITNIKIDRSSLPQR